MSSKRSDSISNCWLTLAAATTTLLLCRAEEEAEEARIAVEEAQAAAAGILGAFSSTTYQIRYNASVVIQVRSVPSLHSHSPLPSTHARTHANAFPGYHYHGLGCIRHDSVRGLHDLNYYATAPLTSFQRVHRTTPYCRGSGDVSLPSVRWRTSVSSLASTGGS